MRSSRNRREAAPRLAVIAAAAAALAGCRERVPAVDHNPPAVERRAEPAPDKKDAKRAPVTKLYPPAPGSFVDLVAALSDSVVQIRSSAAVTGGPDELLPGGGAGPAVGSGFVIDRDGHILTNDHVIARAPRLEVVLADGTRRAAKIAGRDSKLDIALLKIDADPGLVPARLGDSQDLRVGEWLLVLGSPYGTEVTASAGIVAALGVSDRADAIGDTPAYQSFVRTDAVIDASNSGGPVVNMAGEVVAVATASDEPRARLGFAIPIDRAAQVLPMLKKDGVVTRSWLGIYIQPVDQTRAQAAGLDPGTGALLSELVTPGPGAKAGLAVGDIVLAVDNNPVDHHSLPWMASTVPPGRPIALTVLRNGARREIEVVPEKMPD